MVRFYNSLCESTTIIQKICFQSEPTSLLIPVSSLGYVCSVEFSIQLIGRSQVFSKSQQVHAFKIFSSKFLWKINL